MRRSLVLAASFVLAAMTACSHHMGGKAAVDGEGVPRDQATASDGRPNPVDGTVLPGGPLTCTTLTMCTTYTAPGLDPTTITTPRGGALADGLYQLRAGNARQALGHDDAFIARAGQILSVGDTGSGIDSTLGTWSVSEPDATVQITTTTCTTNPPLTITSTCAYAAQGSDVYISCEKWGGPTALYQLVASPSELCDDGFTCMATACSCDVAQGSAAAMCP